ncbi:transcription elongation factor [Phellopilus nigrolimitatus]|nr:transcription elongation factor [Phellopilus nigrolimitatus]
MSEVAELRKLAKELQHASTTEQTVDILRLLKKDVVVSEALLRESKVGLAVGKLRSNSAKEVADLAKELVKKWKNEVERQKQGGGAKGPSSTSAKPAPVRKASVADSIASPTTPTGASFNASFSKGAVRSAKADGVVINVTADKTRDKCIELIYDSLSLDSGAPNDLILKRAVSIEATVLSDHHDDMGKDYKGKIRSLYLNLKDKSNPGLRSSIVSGELAVSKFCRMTSQEMASEERKAADAAIQEENLHKSLGAEEQQAETDAFQCGRCKQRKTRYRQAQTRSADEPMTSTSSCVNCKNRWKFS